MQSRILFTPYCISATFYTDEQAYGGEVGKRLLREQEQRSNAGVRPSKLCTEQITKN